MSMIPSVGSKSNSRVVLRWIPRLMICGSLTRSSATMPAAIRFSPVVASKYSKLAELLVSCCHGILNCGAKMVERVWNPPALRRRSSVVPRSPSNPAKPFMLCPARPRALRYSALSPLVEMAGMKARAPGSKISIDLREGKTLMSTWKPGWPGAKFGSMIVSDRDSWPPAISTRPLGRSVALWRNRGVIMSWFNCRKSGANSRLLMS